VRSRESVLGPRDEQAREVQTPEVVDPELLWAPGGVKRVAHEHEARSCHAVGNGHRTDSATHRAAPHEDVLRREGALRGESSCRFEHGSQQHGGTVRRPTPRAPVGEVHSFGYAAGRAHRVVYGHQRAVLAASASTRGEQ
jgi:hypothetical protein